MNKIKCIFEKEHDWGYIHATIYYPVEILPKVGEEIYLYYPDGGNGESFDLRTIIKIEKYIGGDDGICYKYICSY